MKEKCERLDKDQSGHQVMDFEGVILLVSYHMNPNHTDQEEYDREGKVELW